MNRRNTHYLPKERPPTESSDLEQTRQTFMEAFDLCTPKTIFLVWSLDDKCQCVFQVNDTINNPLLKPKAGRIKVF